MGFKFLDVSWNGVFGCFPTPSRDSMAGQKLLSRSRDLKTPEIFQVESVTSEVFSNLNHSTISEAILELAHPPHQGPLGGLILPDPAAPPPEIQDLGSQGQLLFPTKPALNRRSEPPSPSSSSKSHGIGSVSLIPVGSSLPLIPVRTFPVLRSPPFPGSPGSPDPTGKGGVG